MLDEARYKTAKWWRGLVLALGALLAAVGGVIVWVAHSFHEQVPAIMNAALGNAADQLDTSVAGAEDDHGAWLTAVLIASIIATFTIPVFFIVYYAWIRKDMKDARALCIEGKDAEANSKANGVVNYYIAGSILIGLVTALAIVCLVWGIAGLANTEASANDHYFYMLVVIGLSIAGLGHAAALIMMVVTAVNARDFCTPKEMEKIKAMTAEQRRRYRVNVAGAYRRVPSTQESGMFGY